MPKNVGSRLSHHRNSINAGWARVPAGKKEQSLLQLRSEELETVPAEKKSSLRGAGGFVSTGSFIFPWQTDTGTGQLLGISESGQRFNL